MLVAFLIILYTLFVFYAYGTAVVYFFQCNNQKSHEVNPFLTLLTGLMVVVTLASFASLFMRINWEFHLLLSMGALLLFILVVVRRRLFPLISMKNFNLAQKIGLGVLVVCLLVILAQSALVPANSDTGIYHAQAIRWIESYPAVPGLANLHERFGYNSSWMVGNAVFSLVFLGGRSFHLLTGTLFVLMLIYFYTGIHELLGKKFKLSSFLKFGFFASTFIFLIDQVSSPGTDAPVTLLIWFLVCEAVKLLEEKPAYVDQAATLLLSLLAFFTVTIKVSSAPILLLPLSLWIYFFVKKQARKAWRLAGMALIVLLPFVIRNVILTGYPVYPGFPVDLFHFDWAVPAALVEEEGRIIHWFAILPSVSFEEFLGMSRSASISAWLGNQLPRHKAVLYFIPVALVMNLVLLVFRGWRKSAKENFSLLLVYLVALAGCLFWFFSAPAIRFGYGFLLAAVCLLTFPLVVFVINRVKRLHPILHWLFLAVCTAAVAFGIYPDFRITTEQVTANLVLPADYPTWSSQPCEFGDFKMLCQAYYDSCWYSPFPCAYQGSSHVFMRGRDYVDGFRYIP